ncbi:MAG: GMC family oxidoreductase [Acidobacteria bacterium]|nr:GMC family oxidoreductase [Acidobacteriota bacterium]
MEAHLRARHLVVGSGAGGAVTAAYLAEAGEDVLVLEEGGAVSHGTFPQFSLEQVEHQYRDRGMTTMYGNYLTNYAEGCCVGGSTEVNSGLYHLPDAATLAAWSARFAISDLSEQSLAAAAADVEETIGLTDGAEWGSEGATARLHDGARVLGWSVQAVPRWAHREPSGSTVWHGMSSTFLPRAERAGARLLPDSRVERIESAGGRVTGAAARHPDGTLFSIEAEEVWCCAGAIGSPALLQRSGIGDLRGALSAHPTVKAVARFPEDLGPFDDVPVHQVKEFGPSITLGGSARSPSQVALALAAELPEAAAFLDQPGHAGVYYAAVSPSGNRGRITTPRGAHGGSVPLLWVSRDDRALLAAGLRRLCHLLLAAGAIEIRVGIPGIGAIRGAGDLCRLPDRLPLSASLMTVHTFSSLPMGELPGRCPIDSFGNLKGWSGLHVNDASIIPSAPGINPQGTVMALAARNVAGFLSASGGSASS